MSEWQPVDILLVEDNPGDVRLIEEAFKDARIANTLHVVSDYSDAFDFLRQRGEFSGAPRPDIALLGLDFSRTNDEEALAEIESDSDLRSIPVIVLACSEAHKDRLKSNDLCASAYLTKPIDPSELIEIFRRLEAFYFSIVRIPDAETCR